MARSPDGTIYLKSINESPAIASNHLPEAP